MTIKAQSAAALTLLSMVIGLPLVAGASALQREHRDQIARSIETFAKSRHFSGSIAIAEGTHDIYLHAFGLRNREKGLSNETHTRFQVGSVSKWITVIALLKLLDRGKLSLDAPITTYLTEYPASIGNRITVANLLSNMSGLQDRLPTSLINEPTVASSRLTAAQAATVYAQGPLVSNPGSTFDYSHTNWVLVQAIAERAAGMPLEQLLTQTVFLPLHLHATGVTHGSFERVQSGAVAYESADRYAARELHIIPNFLISTGTLYSTCDDLIRLAHAVYETPLLSPSALQELTVVRYQPEDYAMGGRVRYENLGGVRKGLAFEVGSFGGFKAVLVHVMGDDVTVVVLNNTNMSEDELTRLSDGLLVQYYLR